MPAIHITDIEAAINHWRNLRPSPDGVSLAPEVQVLAEVYARMAWQGLDEVDEHSLPLATLGAWLAWYDTTPIDVELGSRLYRHLLNLAG